LIVIGLAQLPAADNAPEYGIKAAFLLNFMRFVDWPETAFSSSDAPREICILGRDPFGRDLTDIMRGEVVQDRSIVVRRVSQIAAAGACQVVFVSAATNPSRLRSIQPMGTLIVADDPRFLRDGAMIAFVLEAKRVRFDVNQKAAEMAGLKISSKLLSLARMVVQ
jgi:hypothetical protein